MLHSLSRHWLSWLTVMLTLVVVSGRPASAAPPAPDQADVFIKGTDGYHTFRIPAIIATTKGTLLAFCEGRKNGAGDAGDIDLVLKRSVDQGKTWEKMQVVWDEGTD